MTILTGDRPRAATRVAVAKGQRDWFRIQNADGDRATILLYDEISLWGVTAQDFVHDLRGIRASTIELRIHSPGGDVFDAFAIYNALREHPARVEVHVDSLAASAASVIAMAGDRIVMAKPSEIMIHDAMGLAFGNAGEFREYAGLLDKFSGQIAQVYADRAGGSTNEWRDRMLAETWLDQDEAVAAGLADEVAGTAAKVENHFDLSVFANVPDRLKEGQFFRAGMRNGGVTGPTKREVEAALRDAGLSKTQAMAILAGGWPDSERRDSDAERLLATLRALTAA